VLTAGLVIAPAQAADVQGAPACNVAMVTVWGVIAPVSTFGLLKNLEAIPGVANASFNLRHALATVLIQPGATVTDDQFRAAVRKASYTPREIVRSSKCPTAPAAGQ
jgi:mercuric ion binding protein